MITSTSWTSFQPLRGRPFGKLKTALTQPLVQDTVMRWPSSDLTSWFMEGILVASQWEMCGVWTSMGSVSGKGCASLVKTPLLEPTTR